MLVIKLKLYKIMQCYKGANVSSIYICLVKVFVDLCYFLMIF